ncbi:MAG: sugar phosphate isomerase/epimerase [Planctomycetota bacterium]|nr:MAG: sugar phosphate isomerase/epimerase [Planctomycetota bacterium]
MAHSTFSRRNFLRGAAAGLATAALTRAGTPSWADHREEATAAPGRPPRKIYKAVKWGMVQGDMSVLEKFELQRKLGFDGAEMNAPLHSKATYDQAEVLSASQATGLPIHGVVDSWHWVYRLSSPDPEMRAKGREGLTRAIKDSHHYGGSTVLLVPGRVTGDDENHDHVWQRSIEEIRKVLPLASRLGIRILIENVWNGFCEKPEQARDYIDEIDSPWVGYYFDIGNHQKFGPSHEWIRVLGRRIVKLDAKDWGKDKGGSGFDCKLGEGDVDWKEVRRALDDIGYTGWATAELAGGDEAYLADVSARMDQVFGL